MGGAELLWRQAVAAVLLFSAACAPMTAISPRRPLTISRNVRIDWDPMNNQPIVSWPEGIRLTAPSSTSSSSSSSRAQKTEAGSVGDDSEPETFSSPTSQTATAASAPQMRSAQAMNQRRTYTWEKDELLISCNMTALSNPTCTRLLPPITWMSASGSRCKVLHNAPDEQDDSIIEIGVSKTLAEGSLSALRMSGFKREDIYRMLDKGPWVLAFDIAKVLPKIMADLEVDLSLNRTEAVHVVSHCPFLIAQYARYRGRDVYTTVLSLVEVGYDRSTIIADILRFPSMLAAPPDRLRSWLSLLQGFGVAKDSGLFGKLLKRAPFMFYVNPPSIWEAAGLGSSSSSSSSENSGDASTSTTAFVVKEALDVLQLLSSLGLPDLDKVVRTQPTLLLTPADEVKRRCDFLLNLFLDAPFLLPTAVTVAAVGLEEKKAAQQQTSVGAAAPTGLSGVFTQRLERSIDVALPEMEREARQTAKQKLGALLLSFPAILSIDFEQMRSAGNTLRAAGMGRSDVVALARRHPPLLSRRGEDLQELCSFLRSDVGVRHAELVPILLKYPAMLSADVGELRAKVEYLKLNVRGTPAMLKRYPLYLSFDLDAHIRPRAEFLRALGVDPLVNGLHFLVNSPPAELSQAAGLAPDVFGQFKAAFLEMWKKKKRREDEAAVLQKLQLGLKDGAEASLPIASAAAQSVPAPAAWTDGLAQAAQGDDDALDWLVRGAFEEDDLF